MWFRSERTFKVWDYKASLGQLLLRSPSSAQLATNIDVVFWRVTYMEIRTVLEGIEIVPGRAEEIVNAQERLGELFDPHDVRSLRSLGRRFLIVAGGFKVFENMADIGNSTLLYASQQKHSDEFGVVLAHS